MHPSRSRAAHTRPSVHEGRADAQRASVPCDRRALSRPSLGAAPPDAQDTPDPSLCLFSIVSILSADAFARKCDSTHGLRSREARCCSKTWHNSQLRVRALAHTAYASPAHKQRLYTELISSRLLAPPQRAHLNALAAAAHPHKSHSEAGSKPAAGRLLL